MTDETTAPETRQGVGVEYRLMMFSSHAGPLAFTHSVEFVTERHFWAFTADKAARYSHGIFWVEERTITDWQPLGASEAGQDSLTAMLQAQQEWSEATFGPGARLDGLLAHIRKELDEIAANPNDVTEWIDVVILALDGAWRSGHAPEQVVAALQDKYRINREREWPDWRTAEPGKPIEHVRQGASDGLAGVGASDPLDDEVEALARVLAASLPNGGDDCFDDPDPSDGTHEDREWFRSQARAVLAAGYRREVQR